VSSRTVHVILPAYNEAQALSRLLPELARTRPPHQPYEICLVDDGSQDATALLLQQFKKLPVRHLRHEQNQGYGAALRTGFGWVIRNAGPDDIAVSLDADNSHPPEVIPELVAALDSGSDVVTAAYACRGGRSIGVPFPRRVLSHGANWLFRLRFHLPGATTYTNGFRAYRVSALQRAAAIWQSRLIELPNFAGGTELFIKVARTGARVGEIPFTLHYENRLGASKINIPRTIEGYLRLLTLSPRPV
jgi:dolichol-phosphate mannosyltransferase